MKPLPNSFRGHNVRTEPTFFLFVCASPRTKSPDAASTCPSMRPPGEGRLYYFCLDSMGDRTLLTEPAQTVHHLNFHFHVAQGVHSVTAGTKRVALPVHVSAPQTRQEEQIAQLTAEKSQLLRDNQKLRDQLDAAENSKAQDLAALCEQLKVALAGVQVKAVDSSGMADELAALYSLDCSHQI